MLRKSLKEFAKYLNQNCSSSALIEQFAIDSRSIEKGGVFFALQGEKFDGHNFLQEIAQKGAIAAVVQKSYKGPNFGLFLFPVEDVKKTLQDLAHFAFLLRKEKVIAITGSMGKTTTKEFVATLLQQKFRVAKTPGNYNTQLTLPLTILNLQEECDLLVLEMGMGKLGQIARLVQIAPPDVSILTRIAPAGMENFEGGLDAIAMAKSEIFSHPKTSLGIVSIQASRYPQVLQAGNFPKWVYGWKKDFSEEDIGNFVMEKRGGELFINDSPPFSLNFDASHLEENFLAAAAASRAMGLTWEEIQRGASKCQPYPLRFEKIERDGVIFIQDCYNANPDSVQAALKNLPSPKSGGKVIGVLGRMPDLGDASSFYHQQIGKVAQEYLDQVFTIGKDAEWISLSFQSQGRKGEHFLDVGEIKKKLFATIQHGDVVLIKGANSLKLWQILES